MEERYIITVIGKQTVDGESDKIEVFTAGDMTVEDGRITITYPEYPEDRPELKTETTVTLENGVLSIDRQGEMSSHLILEFSKSGGTGLNLITGLSLSVGNLNDTFVHNSNVFKN